MKKLLMFVGAACAAGVAFADETRVANPDGILEASSVEDLQTKIEASGADGLTLGAGMLKWTGTGVTTWPGAYTAAAVSNLAVTVNVIDPTATLKIAGGVSEATDSFFSKAGPGTVEFTKGGKLGWANGKTPWGYGFWKTYYDMAEATWCAMTPTWDDQGILKGSSTAFTIHEGTVRFNAPGETFNIGNMPWVGSPVQASSVFEITNQTTVASYGGWFSIARGTGTSGNNATPVLRIVDGSSLSMGGLCMGNGNYVGSHYSRGRLEIEKNSKLTIASEFFQPENSGNASVSVKDHSSLEHNYGPSATTGWKMNFSASTAFDNCSTGTTQQLAMGDDTTFSVTDKSVFKLNRSIPATRNDRSVHKAKVTFDDSTLMPRSKVLADWFGNVGQGYTNFTVGAKGMTMETDSLAYFGSIPKAAAATSKIVKTGSGTLHLQPQKAVPVEVEAGSLAFDAFPFFTNGYNQTLAPAADNRIGVFGEGALAGMTIAPSGDAAMDFAGRGKVFRDWAFNGAARVFADGTIQLTVASSATAGSVWRKSRVAIDRSFTVTYDTLFYTTSSSYGGGSLLVFQNKDTTRIGGTGGNLGYNYGDAAKTGFQAAGVTSYGVGLELNNAMMTHGQGANGATVLDDTVSVVGATKAQLAGTPSEPCRHTVRYDAAKHQLTHEVFVPSLRRTYTKVRDIDLATHIGATTAYVGFVGGSGGDTACDVCVANYRYVTDETPAGSPVVRNGGHVALGAGKTLSARLSGNEATSVFAVDSLAANGAVTLDVEDAGTAPTTALPPLTSTDESVWTFSGNGHWTSEGPAAAKLESSASGGLMSKYAYPVTGSWNLSFDYKTGYGATYHPIADVARICIGNADKPSDTADANGFSYFVQMYDNAAADKNCFWFYVQKNGVSQVVEGTETKINLTGVFNLWNCDTLHFDIAYDDAQKTLTTTISQRLASGTVSRTYTLTGFDAATVCKGDRAKLWEYQRVGGYQSLAIIANLKWTGAAMTAATRPATVRPALAFDKVSGATTITKTGSGDLAFLKPDALGASVTLAEGGLRLAKEPLEPVTVGANGGWIYSASTGFYTDDDGLRIGSGDQNNRDSVNLRRRVRVNCDWRAHWKMWNLVGADGISFFLHNDPRGNNVVGANNTSSGYTGIQKGRCLSWYTYTNTGNLNKMGTGTTATSFNDDVSPVNIRGATSKATAIDTTVVFDSVKKELKVTLKQGDNTFEKTYSADVVANVGDDYAYLGFGTGGGGVHTYPYYDNFTFEILDETDMFAAQKYLASVDVTADTGYLTLDTPLANGTFNVADAVTIEAGKTLRAMAANESATLKTATLTLGEDATVAGDANVTVKPDAIVATGTTLKVDGVTLDIPADDVAAEKFDKTTLYLSNGAKVRVFGSTCSFKDVYVDGVKQPKGTYTQADWIASDSPYGVNTAHGFLIFVR